MNTFAMRSGKSMIGIYVSMLAATALTLAGVIWFGEPSHSPRGAVAHVARAATERNNPTLQILVALIALLLTSMLLAALCRRIHQPPVIGEIVAGICLGPSLLGRVAPSVQEYLIPASVAPQLGTLSHVGVILFMFLVGLELDTSVMRAHSRSTAAISHASIVAPFLLGSVAAIWLYPAYRGASASFTVFALFLGISLSVTAFPVLARILTDNGLQRSPMGTVALTCAAVDDVTAWCLLALVVGIAKTNAWSALITCVCTVLYVGALVGFARPFISKWAHGQGARARVSTSAITLVLLGLLASALITEQIGIHSIFGAFVLGAIIPHDSALASALKSKFQDLVVILLMPAFYALTGLRTQFGLVQGSAAWLVCGGIIALACLGKFGGSYWAARAVGLEKRNAASIGILMNTRGLMELVVLNLGLDLGVISPTLFAMMVLMALVTTFLTSPLLRLTHFASAPAAPQTAGSAPAAPLAASPFGSEFSKES